MTEETTVAVQAAIDRFNVGDSRALDALFAAAARRMERIAHAMLLGDRVREREETGDVVQEASIKLTRALSAMRDDQKNRVESSLHFFRLTACVMRRTLLDLARRFAGQAAVPLGGASDSSGLDPIDTASGPTETIGQWDRFHTSVETLPEELRDVFDLLWYDELTQEEAARLLGVSPPTVKRRWRDAKLALIELLGDSLPGAV